MHRLFPAALPLRRLERHDQIGRRREADLVALLSGQIAERNRQMCLAYAGRAEKDDVLGTLDEGEASKLTDLLARHTRREAEVKAVERFDRGEAGNAGEHLAGPGSAGVTLGAQYFFEKVGKRGRLGGGALRDRGVEIGNGAEPQLAGQFGQALVLQVAHRTPPAKTSYSDSGCCMPMIGAGSGVACSARTVRPP